MAGQDGEKATFRGVHPLLSARDYQDRPEFGQLCAWWRSGSHGACALVGIGGSGKTAVVDRFLRVLPAVFRPQEELPKDETLPTPKRLFVFSLYDAPNADAFFAQLAAWLRGEPYDESVPPPSYEQTMALLEDPGACLIVLDGLEKLQDDSLRGGVSGRITDGRLRNFVLHVAEGNLPDVAVVITTRFSLSDPVQSHSPYYQPISVEALPETAAMALLRARGVTLGTGQELMAIARDQGCHALTVDLLGGYIGLFCDGDPARLPPDPVGLAEDWEPETSLDEVAQVRLQEKQLARVAARYRDALALSDPAALAVLQRLCLFRLDVRAETLASIFTGPGKEHISGPDLAALSSQDIRRKLRLLGDMRLIEIKRLEKPNSGMGASRLSTTDLGPPPVVYSVHPAVRDGFLSSLGEGAARRGHDAAREAMTGSLSRGPGGSKPSSPAELDLLEEIVYHTIKAGLPAEAWDVYVERIGGGRNLAWRLNSFPRFRARWRKWFSAM